MKSFLAWWYGVSLPQREPDTTPAERERTRYARLTSTFSLLIVCITFPLAVNTIINRVTPSGPIVAVIGLACAASAIVCNKLGFNRAAAFLLILDTTMLVAGALLRNDLDPAFVPVFCSLVITILLAGSLMPPVFALLVGLLNCAIIVLDTLFQKHTAYYDQMVHTGGGSLVFALPILLQIIVAVVTYVILSNLITTIRRADRAEEIVALQKEIVNHQRRRNEEREELEAGIAEIAQAYAAIANGDLETRVQVAPQSLLWQVAAPLNTLLSRAQHWKQNSDQWERTLLAIKYVRQELQQARALRVPPAFQQPTETPVDLLIPEVYMLSRQAYRPTHSRPADNR
ncbi:MAG TPA: hypothetical protein VH599_01300 [Ktedonobacterales bacterium]|jgi:hypothetical protein